MICIVANDRYDIAVILAIKKLKYIFSLFSSLSASFKRQELVLEVDLTYQNI